MRMPGTGVVVSSTRPYTDSSNLLVLHVYAGTTLACGRNMEMAEKKLNCKLFQCNANKSRFTHLLDPNYLI